MQIQQLNNDTNNGAHVSSRKGGDIDYERTFRKAF